MNSSFRTYIFQFKNINSNILFCDHFVEENSLSITREIREEDLMYSIVNYASENEDTLNLVEGEKVYVVGKFKTLMIIS